MRKKRIVWLIAALTAGLLLSSCQSLERPIVDAAAPASAVQGEASSAPAAPESGPASSQPPSESTPSAPTSSQPPSESTPSAPASSRPAPESTPSAPASSRPAPESAPSAPASSEPPPESTSSEPPPEPTPSGPESTVSAVEAAIQEANVEAKAAQSSETPKPRTDAGEMKAVWLSYLELQGFAGSSESAFTQRICGIYDNIAAKGLNTVIVQIRPHGDSFYESAYYPWSKCASGTAGTALPYDPTAIMVEEAHARGLAVHAWINPYRTMTEAELATVDGSYPIKAWHDSGDRDDYMVYNKNDGRWWLKPGNQEVQQLIASGVAEILSLYDIEGVHIDDYFYCMSPSSYGDSTAQAKANTTALVRRLYQTVKTYGKEILFGVSPMGAYRLDKELPESDLNYLSTDLALWCSESGYLDYVMPQIYWEHSHATQPFSETLYKWEELVSAPGVRLYVGLAPYKMSAGEIESQIDEIAADSYADGYCLFRYDFIGSLALPR